MPDAKLKYAGITMLFDFPYGDEYVYYIVAPYIQKPKYLDGEYIPVWLDELIRLAKSAGCVGQDVRLAARYISQDYAYRMPLFVSMTSLLGVKNAFRVFAGYNCLP